MKHLRLSATTLIIIAFTLFAGLSIAKTYTVTPMDNGTYPFESSKLSIQMQVPETWKAKLLTDETDKAVVFKYSNPGGDPVFLFSINKVQDTEWLKIKDQIPNSGLLLHTGTTIYYYEKTSTSSLKGANKEEYKAILSHIDEVLHSIKSL